MKGLPTYRWALTPTHSRCMRDYLLSGIATREIAGGTFGGFDGSLSRRPVNPSGVADDQGAADEHHRPNHSERPADR